MSALGQAAAIVALSRSMAEGLRAGDALVSDARKLEHLIREAEGWLLSARRFLDPSVPVEERTDAI